MSHQIVELIQCKIKDMLPSIAIETGTYKGETTKFLSDNFEVVYTIEIQTSFKDSLENKFKNYKNINQVWGSSYEKLPNIVKEIEENKKEYLLFSDAHFSQGGTGYDKKLSEKSSPILLELQACSFYPPKIMILDELNYFRNYKYYPKLQEVLDEVNKLGLYDIEFIEADKGIGNGLILCIKK